MSNDPFEKVAYPFVSPHSLREKIRYDNLTYIQKRFLAMQIHPHFIPKLKLHATENIKIIDILHAILFQSFLK